MFLGVSAKPGHLLRLSAQHSSWAITSPAFHSLTLCRRGQDTELPSGGKSRCFLTCFALGWNMPTLGNFSPKRASQTFQAAQKCLNNAERCWFMILDITIQYHESRNEMLMTKHNTSEPKDAHVSIHTHKPSDKHGSQNNWI